MKSISQDQWFVDAYDALKDAARRALRRSASGREHTLQPTAIVHEAYLRLAAQPERRFDQRLQFLAYAAAVVRSVLVDHARRRHARERPERLWIDVDPPAPSDAISAFEVLDLDVALSRLEAEHPRAAKVVLLRFFAGLEIAEIAFVCEVSTRTVNDDWAFGRAYLLRSMSQ